MIYPLPLHLDGRRARISDGFHTAADVEAGRATRQHRGADFMYRRLLPQNAAKAHPWGSKWYEIPSAYPVPALAPAPGEVFIAEKVSTGWWVALRGIEPGDPGFAFHHLSAVLVEVGDVVGPGEPVGIVGGSPIGYGLVHLHLDVARGGAWRRSWMHKHARLDGVHVDPAPLFAKAEHLTLEQAWSSHGRVSVV